MDNCWVSCQVITDMKKVYDNLIIINQYILLSIMTNTWWTGIKLENPSLEIISLHCCPLLLKFYSWKYVSYSHYSACSLFMNSIEILQFHFSLRRLVSLLSLENKNQNFCLSNEEEFIYSEKATNFCEISTVDLSYGVTVKSTVEILQNFVGFSEYMNS